MTEEREKERDGTSSLGPRLKMRDFFLGHSTRDELGYL